MELIADSLLIGGALAAAFYCWILSVRVRGLKDLDKGLGGAIASLSKQVDDMQKTLKAAKSVSETSQHELEELAARAERASDQLRLMLATTQETRREKPAPEAPRAPLRTAKIEQLRRPAAEPVADLAEQVAEAPQPVDEPEVEKEESALSLETRTSLAEQLQRDIRQKIAGRDDVGDRDDFVRALQDILAAGK